MNSQTPSFRRPLLQPLRLPAIAAGLVLASACALAGEIDVIAVQDKGVVVTVIGHNEFLSRMSITLHAPDWGERAGTYTRLNREVFVIDAVVTTHLWNIFPAVIHVPQPPDMNSFVNVPFFMATGPDSGNLDPLPPNAQQTNTSMTDGHGQEHIGSFHSFFDVFTELPLTGPNGEQYLWDLDGFDVNDANDRHGNFYLSTVRMTVDQLTAVPEPGTWALLGVGLLAGAGLAGRRARS